MVIIYTYFRGLEHDPTMTQQAILCILFKNLWWKCWAHKKFGFRIFDPPCPRLFDCVPRLSTVCPRVGPSQKKTMSFSSNRSRVQAQKTGVQRKKSVNPWKPTNVSCILIGSQIGENLGNCDRTSSQVIKHRGPMIAHVRFLSICWAPNSAVHLFRSFVYL